MQADEYRKYVLKCTDCNASIVVRISDSLVICTDCHSGHMIPVALLEKVAPRDVLGICKSISHYLKGPATYKHSDSILSEVYARLVELNETLKASHWRAVAEAEREAKVLRERSVKSKNSEQLLKLCAARQIARELEDWEIVEVITQKIKETQK